MHLLPRGPFTEGAARTAARLPSVSCLHDRKKERYIRAVAWPCRSSGQPCVLGQPEHYPPRQNGDAHRPFWKRRADWKTARGWLLAAGAKAVQTNGPPAFPWRTPGESAGVRCGFPKTRGPAEWPAANPG